MRQKEFAGVCALLAAGPYRVPKCLCQRWSHQSGGFITLQGVWLTVMSYNLPWLFFSCKFLFLHSLSPSPSFSAIFLSYILIHHLPTIPYYLSFLPLFLSTLSPTQMESLFGSLPEMLEFQRVFLQTLEERIASSPDFSTLETPSQFKVSCTLSNISDYWSNVQRFSVDSMGVRIQNNVILKPGDFSDCSKDRHELWDLEVYK